MAISPKVPKILPSPLSLPPLGTAANTRPANLLKGRDWIYTVPGPLRVAKKQAFTTKNGIFYPAYELNIVIHIFGKTNNAARIHFQYFTRGQGLFGQGTSCMDKGQPITFQLLHNESFPTKKAATQSF